MTGTVLTRRLTTIAETKVIPIAPEAAPRATSKPFLLECCTDWLTTRAIINPGLKATLSWIIRKGSNTEELITQVQCTKLRFTLFEGRYSKNHLYFKIFILFCYLITNNY